MQHDDPAARETGHPHCLVCPLGERFRPQQRPGTQFRAVQIGVAQQQHRRAEAVLPGVVILRDQAMLRQRAEQPVHGRLGQPHLLRDFGDAEPRRAGAKNGKNPGRALHRLDHDNLSAMSNIIQDMP